MLYYHRIDLSDRTDVAKGNNGKKCIVCHYWYFNCGFKFQESYCNACDDLLILCLNISDNVIITAKGTDYRYIIHGISKSDAIHLLENSALDNPGYIQNAYQKK